MFKNRSVVAFLAAVIGLAYSIFILSYFTSINSEAVDDSEAVGAALATVLVIPHMLLAMLATIFAIIGFFTRKAGLILTGAILFASSALLFLLYAAFLIPSIVLGFVGYAQQKKINKR
jgi:predicted RND superfamily exporter protein